MHRILKAFLPLVALMLISSATSQSTIGTCHLISPGGGGTGVWMLPRAGSFSAAPGTVCDARVYDNNGVDVVIPDFCVRGEDDEMLLGSGGTIAVVFGFFNPEASEGTWYDVLSGQTAVWYREDT